MKSNFSVMRDSVNGENKYARIPIRRKRTPISEEEIRELEKIDRIIKNLDILGRIGCLISDIGFPYFAGKIFSYIDMVHGFEYEFIDFNDGFESEDKG